MPRGLVLVIEDDEWVSRLLANAVRDAGYEVALCGTAKAGVEAAQSVEPDCIVCDVDLPDHDGYWVAQNVRTLPSRVSVTPFLFLSALDDQEARLEGFHVGADVYMTKPFRVDEVVAQVGALVQMAARLRERRNSFLSIPAEEPTAIEGDLSQMSIATVLTVLEMERRTGTFEVMSKKRRAQLEIAGGFVVSGSVGGTQVSALAALRTMLGWTVGRFSFAPGAHRDPPPNQKSIGAFLIEAVRLEDETGRADYEVPGSRRADHRLSAPALGGPAATADDLSPPSTRGSIPDSGPPTTKPASRRPPAPETTRGQPSAGLPRVDAAAIAALGPPRAPLPSLRTGLKLGPTTTPLPTRPVTRGDPAPPAAPPPRPPPPPPRKPSGAMPAVAPPRPGGVPPPPRPAPPAPPRPPRPAGGTEKK